jgi:hypothetical protein
MIFVTFVPIAAMLGHLRGSIYSSRRTNDFKPMMADHSNNDGDFLTSQEAQIYFPTGPLTPERKELLQYIQQLKAERKGDDVNEKGGRACTGEPRVDPSRQIQPNQGDSEWVDDW